MKQDQDTSFITAEDGTLYWTLSLHVPPSKLWLRGNHCEAGQQLPLGVRFDRARIAAMQLREPVSRALSQAIEPLFNDIADRDDMGCASDYLFAIDSAPCGESASACARRSEAVEFHPPPEIGWTTEGKTFVASPDGLDRKRAARMQRFWFVHPDGALSWHMGVSLRFGHDPADYMFLSMLQKLTAPKEFALSQRDDGLGSLVEQPGVSVFSDEELGISPLDRLKLAWLDDPDSPPLRFWHAIKAMFEKDAANFVTRLRHAFMLEPLTGELPDLLLLEPIVEVPGLLMPRCRSMMYFHDRTFFERLSPRFDDQGNLMERRSLVQDDCYLPYAVRLAEEVERAEDDTIRLGDGDGSYWEWVRQRPEYAGLDDDQIASIRDGNFVDEDGWTWDIPTFSRRRTDCLEYMFLSGFNQNIIDFMNQDPSEILDGTDPLYPSTEEQAREGFFVRFANHRSIITYASKSRSLEVGNDYISTCPYAFMLHVLSMHNEFLARDFGKFAAEELLAIESDLEQPSSMAGLKAIGQRINALKIARFRDYEQHRYVNVFRYDTERDVFAELDQLRGVNRKDAALEMAIASLEDHAADLDSHRSEERERNIGAIAFVFGTIVLADGLVSLGEIFNQRLEQAWAGPLTLAIDVLVAGLIIMVLVSSIWLFVTRYKDIADLFDDRRAGDTRRD